VFNRHVFNEATFNAPNIQIKELSGYALVETSSLAKQVRGKLIEGAVATVSAGYSVVKRIRAVASTAVASGSVRAVCNYVGSLVISTISTAISTASSVRLRYVAGAGVAGAAGLSTLEYVRALAGKALSATIAACNLTSIRQLTSSVTEATTYKAFISKLGFLAAAPVEVAAICNAQVIRIMVLSGYSTITSNVSSTLTALRFIAGAVSSTTVSFGSMLRRLVVEGKAGVSVTIEAVLKRHGFLGSVPAKATATYSARILRVIALLGTVITNTVSSSSLAAFRYVVGIASTTSTANAASFRLRYHSLVVASKTSALGIISRIQQLIGQKVTVITTVSGNLVRYVVLVGSTTATSIGFATLKALKFVSTVATSTAAGSSNILRCRMVDGAAEAKTATGALLKRCSFLAATGLVSPVSSAIISRIGILVGEITGTATGTAVVNAISVLKSTTKVLAQGVVDIVLLRWGNILPGGVGWPVLVPPDPGWRGKDAGKSDWISVVDSSASWKEAT